MIWWLIEHPRVHRLVHRWTVRAKVYENPEGYQIVQDCFIDRLVWRSLAADPQFLPAGASASRFFSMHPEAFREVGQMALIESEDDITIEDAPAPDEDTTPESPKSDPVPEDAEAAPGTEPAP